MSSLLNAAIQKLSNPPTTGSNGSFTVTLTWDGLGDVDLHVFEPNGSHVYYEVDQGVVGYLDVDNVVANGPEHYYASCDSRILESGIYRIGINNYRGASGRTATLQVASARDGVLATRSLGVGPERGSSGNQSPIPVFNIIVTKEPTTDAVTYIVVNP